MFSLIRMEDDEWICFTDFKTRSPGVAHMFDYKLRTKSFFGGEGCMSEDLDHVIIPGEFT